MVPWKTVEAVDTKDGRLELRRRGQKDILITIDGAVLMSSMFHQSETELGKLGCEPVCQRPAPRLLTAGLGLGFTLRAALDTLPASAHVVVAELNPVVAQWCRGPAAMLTDDALADKRVKLVVGDVMECVREAAEGKAPKFDAIVVDLYVGPGRDPKGEQDAVYADAAVTMVRNALTKGGVYAVWGEDVEPVFEKCLKRVGFNTKHVRSRGPGPRHAIYLATKP